MLPTTKLFKSAGYRSGHDDYDDGVGGTATLAYRNYARPITRPLEKKPEVRQGIYYSLYVQGEYFKGIEKYNDPQLPEVERTITSISPGFTIGLHRTIFEVLYFDFYNWRWY
jgi:hypothetical protein